MERLDFYPKGESLNGKNYIFIAAHPEDRERYFDLLRQQIRSVEENCVFWYDTRPEEPWDDTMGVDIARMQLILFPVTAALLGEENSAMGRVLPFALEHHLTVMPILMEQRLEAMYRRVFGDLQYLDMVTEDPTAIPYAEKLRRFLQDTLISGELAQKIRQAFDAYIFLSYRKKDRALAAKLMQLIHQIPQMRDVAIWYDEFLIPGENFNENIAQAMDKSHVFAMAVTPNLVSEDNYVLSTEYPKAAEADMPMVAAQVEKTDPEVYRKKLEEAVKDKAAPEAIDAYQGTVLQDSLLGKLEGIALAQKDDPMHNYLMGLAFLHGIDVEVDHKRAVDRITHAAEQDCPDAMEQLATMYLSGTGVKRDIAVGMQWQEKAVDWWQRQWEASGEAMDRYRLAQAQERLGHRSVELGFAKEAAEAIDEAVKNYAACEQELGAQVLQKRRDAQEMLVYVYMEDNNCNEALKAIGQLTEELDTEPAEQMDIQRRDMLARLYGYAGLLEVTAGHMEQAKDMYRKCLDIASDSIEGRSACSNGWYGLGRLHLELEEADEARKSLLEAIRISQDLLDSEHKMAYSDQIVRAQMLLGEVYCLKKNFQEAKNAVNRALKTEKDKAQATGSIRVWVSVGECYNALGRVYRVWDKKGRAEDCHREAARILRKVAQFTGTDRDWHCLAVTYQDWGDVGGEQADDHYQEAERLYGRLENHQLRDHGLARVYLMRSDICSQKKDFRQEKRYLDKAKDLAEQLLQQGDFRDIQHTLGLCYLSLGVLYHRRKNPDSAAKSFEKSVEIFEALPPCRENDRRLEFCCQWLSAIYSMRDLGKADLYNHKAKQYGKKAGK